MRFFFRLREQRDADLDEEIRSHFRLAIEERIARGESRVEAERAVHREFGNVVRVKEVTREMWGGLWLDRLLQDVRMAIRSLKRAPGFTIVAVLTLALGVGANTAVFTVVRGVLLRPLPFPEAERLVLVSYGPEPGRFLPTPGLSEGHYLELVERNAVFERLTTFSNRPTTLTGVGEPARLNLAAVTTDFFDLLGTPLAIGRGFLPGEDEAGRDAVVVLGDGLWRTRFAADLGVIGRTVTLDGTPRTVVGIMPPGFDFPNGAELWTPFAVRSDPHNSMIRPVVARLRRDVSEAQARAAFTATTQGFSTRDDPAGYTARVQPLKTFLVGRVQHSLWIFSGAVGFVLLIACANVANLLLMRAVSKGREITLRSALGASRGRLMRQFLTESIVTSILGGAAGALLAFIGVKALLVLAPAGRIPRMDEIHVDAMVLGFTLLVSVLTGIGFGLVPAIHASRSNLQRALNVRGQSAGGDAGRVRSVLVMAQIALALILVTGAGLMIRSFRNMRAVDLGFAPANVLTLTVDLPGSRYGAAAEMQLLHDRVLQGLEGIPGVDAAGAVNWRPLGRMSLAGDFEVDGGPVRSDGYWADKMAVSPDYFRALGIRLLQGRFFNSSDDAGAAGVVIVSRTLADRFWPERAALGRRISMWNSEPKDWLTVVGVVEDVLQREITGERGAALYQPYAQVSNTFFLGHMTYVVRSQAAPRAIAPALRSAIRTADAYLPVQNIASMDELIADMSTEPLFQTRLLAIFALIALALSAVGVYGVLSYMVAQRRFEIGIRVALGARTTDVMTSVLARTCALTLPGILLGATGALAVTRLLKTFLFGVTPTDPLTLSTVALLLCLTAVVASWLPARRAARVDALTALRSD